MITSLDSPGVASQWCERQRLNGKSIGFVATMGALHKGHLSLVSLSLQQNDVTCASIFVNPLQFNNAHDLENYPNNLGQDIEMLEQAGCNMVFTGTLGQFFPDAKNIEDIQAEDPGPAGKGLEGAFRPGHLQGVVTIVKRLFETIGTCKTYFGEKDFQQTLVVRDLANRLKRQNIDINVITCPIIRETSGLAMSSRNQRLTFGQRKIAANIYRALVDAKQSWTSGMHDPISLERIMQMQLKYPNISLEYAAVRDQDNWTADVPQGPVSTARALIAAYLGEVRLIDNLYLGSVHNTCNLLSQLDAQELEVRPGW